jgi:hypothetical protein
MSRYALLFLLMLQSAAASTIYQLRVEGTFTSNSLGFSFDNSGQPLTQNLEGKKFRASINIDLDLLPAFSFNSLGAYGVESTSLTPRFFSDGTFALETPLSFPDSPIFDPGPYSLEPVPVPADGTDVTAPTLRQDFLVQESTNVLQFVFAATNQWTSPGIIDLTSSVSLGLIAQGLPVMPYDPATGRFNSFTAVPSFSSGIVRFQRSRIVPDRNVGVLGFAESTLVSGVFTATSVTGEIITPEPATLWLSTAALGLLIFKRRT